MHQTLANNHLRCGRDILISVLTLLSAFSSCAVDFIYCCAALVQRILLLCSICTKHFLITPSIWILIVGMGMTSPLVSLLYSCKVYHFIR